LRYSPISDKLGLLLTLQLTSEENVSRHVSVQMMDKILQTIAFFMCFCFK